MLTAVPTKIVLKSTTRMSLNDRFSNITPTIQNMRANISTEHQVSAANRRLAQQLAHRPGLQNVGTGMYQSAPHRGALSGNVAVHKKSLQQRLGVPNIKNRLSIPRGGPIFRGRGRGGRGPGRGGIIPLQSAAGDNQFLTSTNQFMAGNINNRGRGGILPRVPRGRGRGSFRARGRGVFNRQEENLSGNSQGGRGFARFSGQNTINRGARGGGMRGVIRGNRRGGRGQVRGRGVRGRGVSSGSNVTVQDLDSQLDAYMARTKTHLDAELEAYMSEVSK